jgi:hypothetical protein
MSCPEPPAELVTFWLAGSLSPADAAMVSAHVESCAECRAAAVEGLTLVKGFRELHLDPGEVVAAAAGDSHSPHLLVCSRCRDEVALLRTINTDLTKTSVRSAWLPGLAAAAALILAVPFLWKFVPPGPGASPPATSLAVVSPATAGTPRRIPVEKASLVALANETVRLRGRPGPRQALLEDLAVALEPYRRDDFEEAARRLRTLGPKYPHAPEIPYYLGVCLLLLDRPTEAIAPLEDAARHMTPPDEANRYLAIARTNAAAAHGR